MNLREGISAKRKEKSFLSIFRCKVILIIWIFAPNILILIFMNSLLSFIKSTLSYLAKLSIVANLMTVVTAPVVSESPLLTILGTYLLTASKKKSRSMSKLRASRRISTCSSTFSNKSDLWAEINVAVKNSPKHSLLKIIFGAKIQTFLHTFELYSDDIWTGDRTKNYTWFYTNAPAFWHIFFRP